MTKRLLLLIAFLPLAAGADNQVLEQLAKLMQGRFDTHASGSQNDIPEESRLIDSRQRVNAPTLGEVVFYLQLNRGAELALYRQRILLFTIDPDSGGIVQNAYVLREPERYVDARSGDAVLSGLTEDDVEPMFQEGCGQTWTADGDAFIGYVDPKQCRIISGRTGRPRRIEAVNLLMVDGLTLAERGYDDEMNQLFGTPQGESSLLIRIE